MAAVAASDHPLFADSLLAPGESAVHAGMERVDFGYAFAPPHRMCIARPEASEKTLLDLEPGQLTMSWSYDDLRSTPLAVDKPPRTAWHVKMQPLIDGKPVQESRWSRGEGYLPMLVNIAEAYLVLGHGDIAAQYLYSSLNHGTPLYTWCEERGQEPHSKKTSGDRQHLWTPVAVVRFVRDALVMEQPDGLHLGLATARSWLAQGQKVGVQSAPTHFGEVSYEIESDVDHGAIRASVTPPGRQQSANILLHLRHPTRARLTRVTVNGVETSAFDAARETIELSGKGERFRVEAWYAPRLS